MNIVIRKAGLMDEGALKQLAGRTILSCYPFFLGASAVRGFLEDGASDLFIEECLGRATVIIRDQHIVGLAAHRGDFLELLMIDADKHGQGLGTTLLDHMEQEMGREHDVIRLESFRNNKAANAFFEARGWEKSRSFTMKDTGAPMVEYTKHMREAAA